MVNGGCLALVVLVDGGADLLLPGHVGSRVLAMLWASESANLNLRRKKCLVKPTNSLEGQEKLATKLRTG